MVHTLSIEKKRCSWGLAVALSGLTAEAIPPPVAVRLLRLRRLRIKYPTHEPYGGILAMRATIRRDFPLMSCHIDPFQIHSQHIIYLPHEIAM